MDKCDSYINDLKKQLRDEANFVKDCFTRFSFQSMALSAIVLGIIARYQPDHPCTALASILILILILTVARIGNYKYSTANRNFGYQLHLERTKSYEKIADKYNSSKKSDKLYWSDEMRYVGWEEAMRSWRIVQSTIFSHMYKTHWFYPNEMRDKIQKEEYKWFSPKELLVKGTSYYAGSYLGAMHAILHFIALLSIFPLFIMCYQTIFIEEHANYFVFFIGVLAIIFSIVALIW